MTRRAPLFHGGVAGLQPGDIIRPNQGHRKHIDGCPVCAALAKGEATPFDLSTPEGWVYATKDRPYARHYASKARGDLYRVQLLGEVEPSDEDGPFPTWRARRARVVAVAERNVTMSWGERERLFIRWGGTPDEFAAMCSAMGVAR